jgi:hypothetical protein
MCLVNALHIVCRGRHLFIRRMFWEISVTCPDYDPAPAANGDYAITAFEDTSRHLLYSVARVP